jgi:hypothetical protein
MTELMIECENIEPSSAVLRVLNERFKEAGLTSGTIFIGRLNRAPDMGYILWHQQGEIPISMIFPQDDLDDDENARGVADDFLTHWNQRDL